MKDCMLYDSIYMKFKNRQKQSIIEIGNINQPLGSRVGMTGKEHRKRFGVKKVSSTLSVVVTQYIVKCICQNSLNCTLRFCAFQHKKLILNLKKEKRG